MTYHRRYFTTALHLLNKLIFRKTLHFHKVAWVFLFVFLSYSKKCLHLPLCPLYRLYFGILQQVVIISNTFFSTNISMISAH